MKLNKKGFGVAEIAIVILLIGILAAAVIAGFMGVKQNAHNAVVSQQEIAETISHKLKHAYPIVLSEDQNGLSIGAGEYEVYDLNGKKIKDFKNTGKTSKDGNWLCDENAIWNEGGELYIEGSGGTIEYAVNALFHDQGVNATTTIEDVNFVTTTLNVVADTLDYNKYYAMNILGGTVNLHNVQFKTVQRGIQIAYGAKLFITADKDEYEINCRRSATGGYTIYAVSKGTEVTIDGGLYTARSSCNIIYAASSAKVTIKNGTFKYDTSNGDQSGNTKGFFYISNGEINILNGFFDYTDATYPGKKYLVTFHKSNTNGTLNISGGEFITDMPFKSGTGNLIITGGAFYRNPSAYVDDESGAYTVTQKSDYVCRDGQKRTMYVVTKNS